VRLSENGRHANYRPCRRDGQCVEAREVDLTTAGSARSHSLAGTASALLTTPGAGRPAGSITGEGTSSIDLVEVVGDDLGWCGVFLGRPRQEVESMTGHELNVERDLSAVSCGEFMSRVELCDHEVAIQWSSLERAGTVDALSIAITPQEASMPAEDLARRVLARLRQLRELQPLPADAPVAYLTLGNSPGRQILMLKTGDEEILDIAYERCFD
jgi:hypothetical protein